MKTKVAFRRNCFLLVLIYMFLPTIHADAMNRTSVAIMRNWQSLSVRGSALPSLIGVPIQQLEVLAWRNKTFEPIPFQVDPDQFEQAAASLRSNDEILIMLKDLGDTPASSERFDAIELQVSDPMGAPKRYAYIKIARQPARSNKTYVEYLDSSHEVKSDSYRIHFKDEFPFDFAVENLDDETQTKAFSDFSVLLRDRPLDLFQISIDQTEIIGRVLFYRAGPLRVTREVEYTLRMPMGIRSPKVITIQSFYRDMVEVIVIFKMQAKFLLHGAEASASIVINNGRDFTLSSSAMPFPLIFRSSVSYIGFSARLASMWNALRSNQSVLFQTFVANPDLVQIHGSLSYRTLPTNRFESVLKLSTSGWDHLSNGMHEIKAAVILAPGGNDDSTLLHELNTPPVVTTTGKSICWERRGQMMIEGSPN
jgi:hypothetical protein